MFTLNQEYILLIKPTKLLIQNVLLLAVLKTEGTTHTGEVQKLLRRFLWLNMTTQCPSMVAA